MSRMAATVTDVPFPGLRQALDYPHRYAAALAEARRIRALPSEMAFDDAFAFATRDRHHPETGRDQVALRARPCPQAANRPRDRAGRRRNAVSLDAGRRLGRPPDRDRHAASGPTRSPVAVSARPPQLRSRHAAHRPRDGGGLARPVDVRACSGAARAPAARLPLRRRRPLPRRGVAGLPTCTGPLVRPGGLIAFHDVSQQTTPDTEGSRPLLAGVHGRPRDRRVRRRRGAGLRDRGLPCARLAQAREG